MNTQKGFVSQKTLQVMLYFGLRKSQVILVMFDCVYFILIVISTRKCAPRESRNIRLRKSCYILGSRKSLVALVKFDCVYSILIVISTRKCAPRESHRY